MAEYGSLLAFLSSIGVKAAQHIGRDIGVSSIKAFFTSYFSEMHHSLSKPSL